MASSLMGSHGVALATAMALSGTVILVVLCRPRPLLSACAPAVSRFDGLPARPSPPLPLRPCIVTAERKRERKKKRVRFAEDVMVEFNSESDSGEEDEEAVLLPEIVEVRDGAPEMPTNWAAMYSGILQDRVQRMACY